MPWELTGGKGGDKKKEGESGSLGTVRMDDEMGRLADETIRRNWVGEFVGAAHTQMHLSLPPSPPLPLWPCAFADFEK